MGSAARAAAFAADGYDPESDSSLATGLTGYLELKLEVDRAEGKKEVAALAFLYCGAKLSSQSFDEVGEWYLDACVHSGPQTLLTTDCRSARLRLQDPQPSADGLTVESLPTGPAAGGEHAEPRPPARTWGTVATCRLGRGRQDGVRTPEPGSGTGATTRSSAGTRLVQHAVHTVAERSGLRSRASCALQGTRIVGQRHPRRDLTYAKLVCSAFSGFGKAPGVGRR
jgi:hypothetical protein